MSPSQLADFNIEDVAARLELQLVPEPASSEMRGVCPACEGSSNRALRITPAEQSFFCYASWHAGDAVALVAHIKSCGQEDAIKFLESAFPNQ